MIVWVSVILLRLSAKASKAVPQMPLPAFKVDPKPGSTESEINLKKTLGLI
jgi:hypothetical protein